MTVHEKYFKKLIFSLKDLEKGIISFLEKIEQKNKISPNNVFETDVYKKQLKENMYMVYETKNILWSERQIKNKYGYYTKITILVSEKIIKNYFSFFIDLERKITIMYEELKYISRLKGDWSREYTEYDMLCDLVVDCYKTFETTKDAALRGLYRSEYICNEELEKNKKIMTMYLNRNRRLKGYLYNYFPKVWCYDGVYVSTFSVYTNLPDEEIKKYIPEILALKNKFIHLKASLIKTCFKQGLAEDFVYYVYL